MDQNPERTHIEVSSEPFAGEAWWEFAACKYNPDMFPSGKKDLSYISKARKVCRRCEVIEPCLEYALSWPSTDMRGLWAGRTPRQLAAEQKRRDIKPSKVTLAKIWGSLG